MPVRLSGDRPIVCCRFVFKFARKGLLPTPYSLLSSLSGQLPELPLGPIEVGLHSRGPHAESARDLLVGVLVHSQDDSAVLISGQGGESGADEGRLIVLVMVREGR